MTKFWRITLFGSISALLLTFFFLLAMLSGSDVQDKLVENQIETASIAKASPTTFECPTDEILPKIPEEYRQNQVIRTIVNEECLIPSIQQIDTDIDQQNEYVVIGIGYRCVSCHANWLYIVDGDEVTFEYSGEDLVIDQTNNGFVITEPARDKQESYSFYMKKSRKEFEFNNSENIYELRSSDIVPKE